MGAVILKMLAAAEDEQVVEHLQAFLHRLLDVLANLDSKALATLTGSPGLS